MDSNEKYLDELLKTVSDPSTEAEERLDEVSVEKEIIREKNNDNDGMTEEDISELLSAAKNHAEDTMDTLVQEVENTDVLDEDVAEIEELLEMDSLNIPISNTQEEQEVASDRNIDVSSEPFDINDASEIDELLQNKQEKKKEKKPGFLEKLLKLMTETDEDLNLSEADELGSISDENLAILEELNAEEEKKKIKEKKPKKEKKVKAKKPKKEKKAKAKKPKKEKKVKEKKEEKPLKKLPKKKVIVTYLFALTILAGILILYFAIEPMMVMEKANAYYEEGNYDQAYLTYYGRELSDEDSNKFESTKIILRMNRKLDAYYNFVQLNMMEKALNSLIESIKVYDSLVIFAQEYNVLDEVNKIYSNILSILSSQFNLSEENARGILNTDSDATYTRTLQSIVNGTYNQSGTQNNIQIEEPTTEEATTEEATTEEVTTEENVMDDNKQIELPEEL